MKKTQKILKRNAFIPLGQDTFVRPGFELIGWNTLDHRDNTTPDYPVGIEIQGQNIDMQLYACWSPVSPEP